MCVVYYCSLMCVSYSVWDIEEGTKLVAQYNSPARITAAEFINPHDISFLLTGSGSGFEGKGQGSCGSCSLSLQMMVQCMFGGTMTLNSLH